MFEYKRLINKSIKSHTLASDIFSYVLVRTGFANKYLAGQVSMYKAYHWLEKRFRDKLEGMESVPVKEHKQSEINEDYVWICWLQGMKNAPKIVRDCFESVCYWLKGKKIIVITEENYEQYVQIPEFIVKKWEDGIISNTHFSDILRLELLIQHGGLWLDATTFFSGPLPAYITNTDFFVYRNGWMDMEMINMANWLIYSRLPNNMILLETQKLLYLYWEKYNYMKNYFLFHMFFRMVIDRYESEWMHVPYFNQIDCHFLMNELGKDYDSDRVEEIKQLTPVHKLTYKFVKNSADSTSDHLIEIYK